MAKKIIYFVRHGETENNANNVKQGPSGGLTERGKAQALETAKRFPKHKGHPQVIISSPYERAKQTAEIIGNELKVNVEFSDLLKEKRNPTEIIGHPAEEKGIKEVIDRIDRSFHDDNFRYADEENFLDLKERARKLVKYIIHRREKRIILVTHSNFLKMTVSFMLLGDQLTASKYNNIKYLNSIENAGMAICSYTPHFFSKGEWKLLVWNDLA